MSLDSVMVSAAVENSRAVSPTAAEIAQVEISVLGNINDKDGDMIPDRLDSTFNPKVTENNKKIPVSNIEEIQSENTQTQEIRAESDDNFDAINLFAIYFRIDFCFFQNVKLFIGNKIYF